MCLIACAYHAHPDYPLLLLANRDEFYARPSEPAHWWSRPQVLAGKDLLQGGTWLGVAANGDFAAVTNVRQGIAQPAADLRSRGELPLRILDEAQPMASRLDSIGTQAQQFGGFNLLYRHHGQLHYLSNRAESQRQLKHGIHLLSNASLNTNWPKTERLRAALTAQLQAATPDHEALFQILADKSPAAPDQLPDTGIPRAWEQRLSPIFINATDVGYGTRASTLLLHHRSGRIEVIERLFDARGQQSEQTFRFQASQPTPQ